MVQSQIRSINDIVKKAYYFYFHCKIGDQDNSWAPHVCCLVCYATLTAWLKGTKKSMPFAVPMIWREPRNHHDDCYFCLTNTVGSNEKKQRAIQYPSLPSAIRPVPHGENLPIPTPPNDWETIDITERLLEKRSPTESDEDTKSTSSDDNPKDNSFLLKDEPHHILQNELNDLVRDLQLSKEKAQLLGARLKQWNLLAPGCTYTQCRKRNEPFTEYYKMEGSLCVCTDINGLMTELEIQHNPSE